MEVSLTEVQIREVLRTFILSVIPIGTEVVKGQENRVPVPIAPNFVVINPGRRTRLATNIVEYIDDKPSNVHLRNVTEKTQIDFQIDVYGEEGDTNVQTITTLFKDLYATDLFTRSGIDAQPLYTDEPMQFSWVDESSQYVNRWQVNLSLQANIVVSIPQDFADELIIHLQVPIDAKVYLPLPDPFLQEII